MEAEVANSMGAWFSNGAFSALVAAITAIITGKATRKVTVENSVCGERHAMLNSQMEDIFARLRRLEANDAAQSAKLEAVEKRCESMDGKLDRIISKLG